MSETAQQLVARLTGFTAGPWRFKQDAMSGDCGISADTCGVFIEAYADIRHPYEGARGEALTNARLVTAAPDLHRELTAALAREAALRDAIFEASHPDFLCGAMDNVNDLDIPLDDFAKAASRAIRAALTPQQSAAQVSGPETGKDAK